MSELFINSEYQDWLKNLKSLVKTNQLKAKLSVNSQLIITYWHLGAEINDRLDNSNWGSKLIDQLSKDLKDEFPEMKGFSRTNLYAIKKFQKFYDGFEIVQQVVGQLENPEIIHQPGGQMKESEIVQQAVGQLPDIIKKCSLIPWGQNIAIIEKCNSHEEVLFYLNKTVENNWSRSILEHQIESNLFERQGKATTNFEYTLPALQSDLANEIMKDPYHFDFMSLSEKENERDFENKLINHISKFLLELGKGFAYMGRQFNLKVGKKDYFLDLLFYHTKLRSYVNIELKIGEFEPEFVGKLNFYINAIDEIVKEDWDKPTIGILLCKTKDDYEVEFALKGIASPIGVSEYKFSELPDEIKNSLPSKEELLNEIRKVEDE